MKVLSRGISTQYFVKQLIAIILVTTLILMLSISYAYPSSHEAELTRAGQWLVAQQQSDGGFELSGYPGFETPDAISALASISQLGKNYNKLEALDEIKNIKIGGLSPLDYVDDLVDTNISAGTAAKIILNVVIPLGLDPYDFDPSNDSPNAVNLVEAIHAAQLPDGSYGVGVFNASLSASLALVLVEGNVPAQSKSYILSGQATDGSFNYAGDPTLQDGGADTTGLTIEFLVASGDNLENPAMIRAIQYLALLINDDGSIPNFGTKDPNSTAATLRALNATGLDSTQRQWRDHFAPSRSGEEYASPETWLISQQSVEGNMTSPNDIYGLNTFATSQTISALAGNVFPLASLDKFIFPIATATTTTTTTSPVQVGGQQVVRDTDSNQMEATGVLANTGVETKSTALLGLLILGLGLSIIVASRKNHVI